MRIDLSRLRLGSGQVFVGAQNLHGRGLGHSPAGAVQTSSNLDAPAFTGIIEAWHSHEFLHGKIRTKAVGLSRSGYQWQY